MSKITPEEIDFLTLPSLPIEQRRGLPSCSGIYFALSLDDEVLYIGRSINLAQRWINHYRQKQLQQMCGIRLAWLEVSDASLLPVIEAALVEYFDPVFNDCPVHQSKTSPKSGSGIKWRLNEVMARHDIRAKELAEEMGVSATTISNLRKRNMPRLTEETLNKLCQALNKLSQEKTLITPGDLIEYAPDLEPPNPKQEENVRDQEVVTAQENLKQGKNSLDNTLSSKRQRSRFLLSVIPEVAESA